MIVSLFLLGFVNIDQYWLNYLVVTWGCTVTEGIICMLCVSNQVQKQNVFNILGGGALCAGHGSWVHKSSLTQWDMLMRWLMKTERFVRSCGLEWNESLRGSCLSSLGTLFSKFHDLGLLIRPLISIHNNCQCLMICCSIFNQMGGNNVGKGWVCGGWRYHAVSTTCNTFNNI